MAPVAEAAQRQRQPAAQGLRHRGVIGEAVAAPVYGIFLAARRGRPCKQARLPLSEPLFQHLKDCLVIQLRVVIVHPVGIGAVKIDDAAVRRFRTEERIAHRDPLAEIGLEAVHAHVDQVGEIALVPFHRVRIGEIDKRHAGLPHIPLPDAAVARPDKIPFFQALAEQPRFLPDIRVDPYADAQSLFLDPPEHPRRIREYLLVPFKAAPFKAFHPEAVEMERRQRDAAVQHPVDERHHRFFIVIGGKRCGQPQAERPCRDKRRFSGEIGVMGDHSLEILPADQEIFHRFARHAELVLRHDLGRRLKRHLSGMVHENAVPLAADKKRDILVRLLAVGPAVLVPQIHRLSVFDECREPFAETVNIFRNVQRQLLAHIRRSVIVEDMRHRFRPGGGKLFPVIEIAYPPLPADADLRRQAAAFQDTDIALLRDLRCEGFLTELKIRPPAPFAHEIFQLHRDHIAPRRADRDGQHPCIERIAAALNPLIRAVYRHGIRSYLKIIDLCRSLDLIAKLRFPHSICKFHNNTSAKIAVPIFILL